MAMQDYIDKKREESQRLRALADPHQSVIAEGRTIKIHRGTHFPTLITC